MARRTVPTSAAHAANLDRLRDRYGRGPTDPGTIARTGDVIVFADGCASWITYPDGYRVATIPDLELTRLVNDPVVGDLWEGAHIARYEQPGGMGAPRFDVELGIALPSYRECPAHREDGTARPRPQEPTA